MATHTHWKQRSSLQSPQTNVPHYSWGLNRGWPVNVQKMSKLFPCMLDLVVLSVLTQWKYFFYLNLGSSGAAIHLPMKSRKRLAYMPALCVTSLIQHSRLWFCYLPSLIFNRQEEKLRKKHAMCTFVIPFLSTGIMRVCVCVCVCVCMRASVCMHVCMPACTRVCVHACVQIRCASNTVWLYIIFEVLCLHFCWSCKFVKYGVFLHPCWWDMALPK